MGISAQETTATKGSTVESKKLNKKVRMKERKKKRGRGEERKRERGAKKKKRQDLEDLKKEVEFVRMIDSLIPFYFF